MQRGVGGGGYFLSFSSLTTPRQFLWYLYWNGSFVSICTVRCRARLEESKDITWRGSDREKKKQSRSTNNANTERGREGRERQRETETERQRHRDRDRHRETETDGQRQTETDKTEADRQTDR